MVEPITDLDPERIRRRLDEVRERAGETEILVACKYVPNESMGALAEAGVELVGENREQDLAAKRERWGEAFTWDFIGNLQSRKVKRIAPLVRLIHSVASRSVLERLRDAPSGSEVLIQVNVAGEEGKGGVDPEELAEYLELCPVPVAGLSTMPPLAARPEDSRPHFARLAELASEHGLRQLSMGTSQDWPAAVAEGATIIRLGSALLR
jgi:PLP dependent protein